MFCSKCGTKIEDGNFCPVCGAPVTGTQNNAGSEENVQMKAPVQAQVPKQAVPPVNTGAGSGNGGKNGNHTAVIMIAVIAVLAVAVIGLLCGVVFSCASQKESGSAQAVSQESTEETDTAVTEESAEAAPETSVDEATTADTADSAEAVSAETAGQNAETSMDPSKLSDDIYSFQCVINNKLYQFPMTYSDFMARGLTIDEYSDDASSLKANSYGLVYYDDEDGNQICVYMYNPAKSEAAIDKCIISGVKYDSYDMKNDKGSMLPGNLAVGKATLDDVTRAYGEASDEYDSDLKDSNRKTLTYTGDTYERVEIVFGPASAIYGADAYAGVVNLITKDGADIDGVTEDAHAFGVRVDRVGRPLSILARGRDAKTIEFSGYGPRTVTRGIALEYPPHPFGLFGVDHATLTVGLRD